jgi:putative membrane protein
MIRPLLIASASASALALAACASDGDMGAATAAAGDMTPEQRDAYVQMAAASDLFEIQSSQIATTRAQSPEVREFAQMLIQHHTATTEQLTAAATAAGSPPSPTLMPMQAEMIARLQGANGAEFDRLYLRQQVPAHEMALALHQNYASDGDTPSLRTVAAAAVPIVRQHLERARALR